MENTVRLCEIEEHLEPAAHPARDEDAMTPCTTRFTLILMFGLAMATAGLAACGDDDQTGDAPQLSVAHPGWERADCAACHVQADVHDGTREWTACFGCHGDNGQPHRPAGHNEAGCTACHSDSGAAPWNDSTHAGYSSLDAADCMGCHD